MWTLLLILACGSPPSVAPADPAPDLPAPADPTPAAPAPLDVAPDLAPSEPSAPDPAEVPAPADPAAPPAAAPAPTPTPSAPSTPNPPPSTPSKAAPATPAPATPAAAPTAPPAAATPPPRGATTYKLSAKESWLFVLIKYDRNTLIKGHDHAARATQLTGSVTWDPADPSRCAVDLSVPVSGLKIDTPGLRARAGLEGDTPADDIPKIEKNMLGAQQLDAARHATISYRATRCAAAGTKVTVDGLLTLKGVSKPVSTTLSINEDGSRFTAKGSLSFKGSTFGLDPFVAALGALKNDDNLKLVLDLVGTP